MFLRIFGWANLRETWGEVLDVHSNTSFVLTHLFMLLHGVSSLGFTSAPPAWLDGAELAMLLRGLIGPDFRFACFRFCCGVHLKNYCATWVLKPWLGRTPVSKAWRDEAHLVVLLPGLLGSGIE